MYNIIKPITRSRSVSAEYYPSNILSGNVFNITHPNILDIAHVKFKSHRSYEAPYLTYYIVFNTFKGKNANISVVQQQCYKKLKYKRILITREINESNIHFNVIVTTAIDPRTVRGWGKHFTKPNIQNAPCIRDIHRLITYVYKESKVRCFSTKDQYIHII